jgi:hypothetical protein
MEALTLSGVEQQLIDALGEIVKLVPVKSTRSPSALSSA